MDNDEILEQYHRAGFDATVYLDVYDTRYIRPRCSQCEAAVINGVACHEHGCPNARAAALERRRQERDEEEDE